MTANFTATLKDAKLATTNEIDNFIKQDRY